MVVHAVMEQADPSPWRGVVIVLASLAVLCTLIYDTWRQYRRPFDPVRMSLRDAAIFAAAFAVAYVAVDLTPSMAGALSLFGPIWLMLTVTVLVYAHIFSRVRWGGQRR